MLVTGTVLYIVPQGRVAYWVHWSLLGLEKEAWGALHINSSLIFALSGILHIYYNWKALLSYFRSKLEAGVRLRKELIVSLLFCVVLLGGTLADLPPFRWVMDLEESVKSSWVTDRSLEPPFGHAELFSLSGFARKQDIDLSQAVRALKERKIEFSGPNESIEEISRANGITPHDLYAIVKPFERQPEPLPGGVKYTASVVEERFAGTGVGQKTIDEIAKKERLNPAVLQKRLRDAGVQFSADETLKDIASKNGENPIDLLKKLLLEE